MTAMFASRNLGISTGKIAKTTEKLASGYKINRAADNASGLAISEKMRRQIRGLARGTTNAQEGVSMCQIADGALAEASSMLHRMTELSIQAANATLCPEDRAYIQSEMNEIKTEISRIGNTTTYNEKPIFGDILGEPVFSDVNLVSSPAAGTGHLTETYLGKDRLYHPSASLDFSNVDGSNIQMLNGKSFTFTCSQSCPEAFDITFDSGKKFSQSTASDLSGQVPHYYVLGISDITSGSELVDKICLHIKNNMPNGARPTSDGELAVSHSNMLTKTDSTKLVIYSTSGYSTRQQAENIFKNSTSPYGAVNSSSLTGIVYKKEDRNLWIHTGAESDSGLFLTFPRINEETIGISDLDVTTEDSAREGIDKIKKALQVISSARSDIGAQQNRLEHTINNNDNVVENTQAAESRIRDTDMAKEMVSLSINNILQQAGSQMLAQANQTPQGVLSLLS